MRVDVHDVARSEVGLAERLGHRQGLGVAGGVRLHHVVGVGGDAGAGQLAVDPGSPGLGVFERLDHQDGRALTQHEPVPIDVPGARGALGFVVAPAHRLHLGETGHRQRMDAGLGAADDDDVRPPSLIMSRPSEMASLLDAQADTGVWAPAWAPSRRLTLPAVALAISIGMASGLTRREPFSFWMSQLPSRVCRPPMPVAIATPSR